LRIFVKGGAKVFRRVSETHRFKFWHFQESRIFWVRENAKVEIFKPLGAFFYRLILQ